MVYDDRNMRSTARTGTLSPNELKPGANKVGGQGALVNSAKVKSFAEGSAAMAPKGTPREEAASAFESYGVPPQLVPESTTAFELDAKTGRFTLSLKEKLTVQLEGAKLVFDSTVSGTLGEGRIDNISGIKGKKGFFSASVSTMQVRGSELVVTHSAGEAKVAIASLPQL